MKTKLASLLFVGAGVLLYDLMAKHPGVPSNLADGPEEVRKKVRELIRMGADVIKVATSGGVLSPRDDPRHAHWAGGSANSD